MTIPAYDITRESSSPLDPAPAMRARRSEGPVVRVRLWDGSTPWLVTGYAAHRTVLGSPAVSVEPWRGTPRLSPSEGRPPKGQGSTSFIMLDDPEHLRLRRMVSPAFTVRRMSSMEPALQSMADALIDDLLAGPNPADLVDAFALPFPSLAICRLLGVPYADHATFQENSSALLNSTTTAADRAAAMGRLATYLDDLLTRKIEAPAEDLLSGLVERIESGELSRRDAVSMSVLMLFAGHETTANMITLGTLALLQHPDQLALLRDTDDPKVVAAAVDELLRFLTITHGGLRRVALDDLEVDGQVIRAGEAIIAVNETANRDPDVFADPDRLDLRRDARGQTSFGYGVHHCLGAPLARLELRIAYRTLLHRMPTLRLATPLETVPFKHDGFVYGAYSLPVAW